MWFRNHNCCGCEKWAEKFTQKKINALCASISGTLFAAGWWCFIDAVCVYTSAYSEHAWFILPGLGSTAAFVLINLLAKLPSMHANSMPRSALWCWRFMLFIGFFLSFSMLFAAVLMFMLEWAILEPQPEAAWSYGFAIPQTALIAASTFMFYFGINIDEVF